LLSDPGKIAWDGKRLNTRLCATAGDVIHDLCHYQMATADRRSLPEYGLGTSPDSYEHSLVGVDPIRRQAEEHVTSLLGIIWERHLGYDHLKTMRSHGWLDDAGGLDSDLNANRTLEWLYSMAFVDQNGKPKLQLYANVCIPNVLNW